MRFFCCLGSADKRGQKQVDPCDRLQSTAVQPSPALKTVELPLHPDHSFPDYGWTTISPHAELLKSYEALLEASIAFFDLPEAKKEAFKTNQGSENGWNYIEGEKEFITLRSLETIPDQMRDAAATYWAQAGTLLSRILGKIAESLGLPGTSLTVYSDPCVTLGQKPTQSMLRLFRYNVEGERSKIVAEAHRDLGLLSLVVSDTPGLEVCDPCGRLWFPLEKTYRSPVLLVGRQLEWLSNGRYLSGGHRVRSYPDSARSEQTEEYPLARGPYRYSIVFVLRAHSPVLVNTDELTTPITGNFFRPLNGITAGELFKTIQAAHFNINTGIPKRDEQKRKLAGKKHAAASVAQ